MDTSKDGKKEIKCLQKALNYVLESLTSIQGLSNIELVYIFLVSFWNESNEKRIKSVRESNSLPSSWIIEDHTLSLNIIFSIYCISVYYMIIIYRANRCFLFLFLKKNIYF